MEQALNFLAPVQTPVPTEVAQEATSTPTEAVASAPVVHTNVSGVYTRRTVAVGQTKDGKLQLCGSATNHIGRYLQAELEELRADPDWRSRLMLVENREGGVFFKLMHAVFLDL